MCVCLCVCVCVCVCMCYTCRQLEKGLVFGHGRKGRRLLKNAVSTCSSKNLITWACEGSHKTAYFIKELSEFNLSVF